MPLQSGDTVVVTAGTSSVGTALIQIARDLGATVIATTRTAARKPELIALGADHAIATEDLAGIVASITDGRGAKVVYDTVGGPLLTELIAATAAFGHMFCYGAQTSPDIRAARVDVPLVALDRKSVAFVDLFELIEFPDRLADAKAYITDARTRGVLTIGIDRVLDFYDVQEAHQILELAASQANSCSASHNRDLLPSATDDRNDHHHEVRLVRSEQFPGRSPRHRRRHRAPGRRPRPGLGMGDRPRGRPRHLRDPLPL